MCGLSWPKQNSYWDVIKPLDVKMVWPHVCRLGCQKLEEKRLLSLATECLQGCGDSALSIHLDQLGHARSALNLSTFTAEELKPKAMAWLGFSCQQFVLKEEIKLLKALMDTTFLLNTVCRICTWSSRTWAPSEMSYNQVEQIALQGLFSLIGIGTWQWGVAFLCQLSS